MEGVVQRLGNNVTYANISSIKPCNTRKNTV